MGRQFLGHSCSKIQNFAFFVSENFSLFEAMLPRSHKLRHPVWHPNAKTLNQKNRYIRVTKYLTWICHDKELWRELLYFFSFPLRCNTLSMKYPILKILAVNISSSSIAAVGGSSIVISQNEDFFSTEKREAKTSFRENNQVKDFFD